MERQAILVAQEQSGAKTRHRRASRAQGCSFGNADYRVDGLEAAKTISDRYCRLVTIDIVDVIMSRDWFCHAILERLVLGVP
jgi:hypothetical protein